MLKIAGKQSLPPLPMEDGEEIPLEEEVPVDEMPTSSMKYDVDKVDPVIAGYRGPELGPFMCGRCDHFDGTGSCNIVMGPIDPEGVCCLFISSESQLPMDEMAPLDEEVVPIEGELDGSEQA